MTTPKGLKFKNFKNYFIQIPVWSLNIHIYLWAEAFWVLGWELAPCHFHCIVLAPIKLDNPDLREGMLSSVSWCEKLQSLIAKRMVTGLTEGLWSFLPSTTPGKIQIKI